MFKAFWLPALFHVQSFKVNIRFLFLSLKQKYLNSLYVLREDSKNIVNSEESSL